MLCPRCILERGNRVDRVLGHECHEVCEQPLRLGGRCERQRKVIVERSDTRPDGMVSVRQPCPNDAAHAQRRPA